MLFRSVLDTICLLKGADILRVHDVREAVEAVKIVEAIDRVRRQCQLSFFAQNLWLSCMETYDESDYYL